MMAATLKNFGGEIVKGIPLERIGSPQDVAGACLFLSSRAGAYVNGATIALVRLISLQKKVIWELWGWEMSQEHANGLHLSLCRSS